PTRAPTPAGPGTPANPCAGLGLANTRERLRLMHAGASLQAGLQGARFVAEVRLPLNEEH
ncbi:MAG TPA: sensor histidine kinase, partial [Massilia sp.]|nr:sensor histidine kinase [Massilia sp.]